MNQILITGVIALAALAATLHQRHAARAAAAELARLQAEQETASSVLAELRGRSEAALRRQAELAIDLSGASAELRAASDAALRARPEPDPGTEGAWPSGKPYFYLPKRLLTDIGFSALSSDGTPTPEAIALLGFTPSERDELRNVWADFTFELQELQVQSAVRMPDSDAVPDPDHPAVRFKLSSLTNHLPRLREQLDARLTEAIGTTRARLLRAPLEERLDELTPPFVDQDSIVTYHAQRTPDATVQHWLRFEADGSMSQYVIDFFRSVDSSQDGGPVAPPWQTSVGSPLWHYRHLFGDQPLLPLP